MIKVDLITGFLGSGKTTFIKKYVRYLLNKGEKVGIIENDYGAINVDMLLLNKEFGDECGMEMVVATDPDCHRRRFKTKLIAMGMDGVNDGKYDRIIVEPSGIYDVDEFFDILYEEPLDRFYEIGNVIAIVDAGLSDELSRESDYLLVSQIAEAGMVVFSKVLEEFSGKNIVERERIKPWNQNVEKVIDHMNRALERFKCGRRYELGDTAKDILVKSWDNLTADDFERIENCGYVPEDHIKLHVAEDNGYSSLFYFHVKMSEDNIKSMVAGLFGNEEFGNIYRVKGFVPTDSERVKEHDYTFVEINATKKQIEINYTDNGQEVIIVIGENLKKALIEDYIMSFEQSCPFCVTVLSDNIGCGDFKGEHGLSLYIEYGLDKILLDAGRSELFYENAQKMGIDLSQVTIAVLSHSHYDHSDGFEKFLQINDKAKLYVRSEAGECYYSMHDDGMKYIGPKKGVLEKYKDRIVYVDGEYEYIGQRAYSMVLLPHSTEGLSSIGERAKLYRQSEGTFIPDDFSHEQTLCIDTSMGIVIINSCSHGGAANIIREVEHFYEGYSHKRKIYAYIGGFHLFKSSDDEIKEFANTLKEVDCQRIITGHCTGEHAFELLQEELGERVEQLHAGMVIDFVKNHPGNTY